MNVDKNELPEHWPHYFSISQFENLSIVIKDDSHYKAVVPMLMKLGYAWSDDNETRNELFYNYIPEKIYACFNASIYFEQPLDIGFKCIDVQYLTEKLSKKIHARGH